MWKLEQPFRDYALLRVFPKTGKTHQIRVHLKHIGLPLAVDPLYNPPRERARVAGIYLSSFKRDYRPARGHEERPLIARLTLHAERLCLDGPAQRPLQFVAEAPKDFRAALKSLQKYDR